jgi:hypothetical protein
MVANLTYIGRRLARGIQVYWIQDLENVARNRDEWKAMIEEAMVQTMIFQKIKSVA